MIKNGHLWPCIARLDYLLNFTDAQDCTGFAANAGKQTGKDLNPLRAPTSSSPQFFFVSACNNGRVSKSLANLSHFFFCLKISASSAAVWKSPFFRHFVDQIRSMDQRRGCPKAPTKDKYRRTAAACAGSCRRRACGRFCIPGHGTRFPYAGT